MCGVEEGLQELTLSLAQDSSKVSGQQEVLPKEILAPSMENPKETIEFIIYQLEDSLSDIKNKIKLLGDTALIANKAIARYRKALVVIRDLEK